MRKRILCLLSILVMTSAAMGLTSYAGWHQEGSQWKYTNETGEYSKDKWELVNGRWYHFDGNGIMQTGWFEESGLRYYLEPENGHMLTGNHVIDGKDCSFALDGHLVEEKPVHVEGLDDAILADAYRLLDRTGDEIDYMLARVNQLRAEVGASPLTLDKTLCLTAAYRSIEMNRLDYFSHYYNGRARYGDVQIALMNDPYRTMHLSENIFRRKAGSRVLPEVYTMNELADAAINWFIGSPSHYEGMVLRNMSRVGFGLFLDESGRFYYATQVFSD